jgi:hypothetical protein
MNDRREDGQIICHANLGHSDNPPDEAIVLLYDGLDHHT